MLNIKKKFIVDNKGNPKEVIILFEDFKMIAELLGLDLDIQTINELRKANIDRKIGDKTEYQDLDSI